MSSLATIDLVSLSKVVGGISSPKPAPTPRPTPAPRTAPAPAQPAPSSGAKYPNCLFLCGDPSLNVNLRNDHNTTTTTTNLPRTEPGNPLPVGERT